MQSKTKQINWLLISASLLLFGILLSGCSWNRGTETVVIPDMEENVPPSGQPDQPFQVGTIYRVPISTPDSEMLTGWSSPSTLVALFTGGLRSSEAQSLKQIGPPYETFEPLYSFNGSLQIGNLSPDGKLLSSFSWKDNVMIIKIFSMADGKEKVAVSLPSSKLGTRQFSWSDNSRYLTYLFRNVKKGTLNIGVYDTLEGVSSYYPVDTGRLSDGTFFSVKLTDDGNSALLSVEGADRSAFLLETKQGNAFTSQYEHETGGQADFLDNNRLMYTGADNVLYVYDLRTAETATILEQVGSFKLSQDKKVLAYTYKSKDEIFAGKLQGNNILHGTSVYKGVIPSFMLWSPDNSRLLIDGRKLYAMESAPAPIQSGSESLPFIVNFK